MKIMSLIGMFFLEKILDAIVFMKKEDFYFFILMNMLFFFLKPKLKNFYGNKKIFSIKYNF